MFRYYHSEPRKVWGKIHVSNEQYFDVHQEIVPVANPRKGNRASVMLHPYVLEPILTLTVGLYKKPKHYADQDEAIGETLGRPKQEGVRDVQVGSAQAWYYPDDKLIVLWECFLENFVRDHALLNDPNMKKLWHGFERFLMEQFPKATRIVTPFNDPIARSIEEYQAFLRSLGYEPVATAAFGKPISR
jgi:hypothetical protein